MHSDEWHRKPKVVMMLTLSSLLTREIVVMTTYCVASDNKFGTMTTLGSQWNAFIKPFDNALSTLNLLVNSLWPRDVIDRHISRSTLVQVMACCLNIPSHYYLKQCLFRIRVVLWHSPERNFSASAQTTILYIEFENYTFKIIVRYHRSQWVDKGAEW